MLHMTCQTARATAAFRFHLDIHLDKEDTHLYRIFKERSLLARAREADRHPRQARFRRNDSRELVVWLFLLAGTGTIVNNERHMIKCWSPEPVFASTKELIKNAIGSEWAELTQRILTLYPPYLQVKDLSPQYESGR